MAKLSRSDVTPSRDTEIAPKTLEKSFPLDTTTNFSAWPWATLLTGFAALVVAADYMLGSIYHHTYLQQFHLSSVTYPIERSETLVNGILVFQRAGWLLFHEASTQRRGFLGLFALCLIAGFVFAICREPQMSSRLDKLVKRLVEIPPPTSRFLSSSLRVGATTLLFSLWCVGVTTLLFLGPMAFGNAFALPAAVAGQLAMTAAQRDRVEFGKLCVQPGEKVCVDLVKNGVAVARGYIITQSSDRVAIFDGGRIRQFPLEGLTLESRSPLEAHQPSVSPNS
jgi:hypothetical protein